MTFTKCHLHVPHKLWADDEHEKLNYLSIERWTREFLRIHLASGGSAIHTDRLLIPHKPWANIHETENYHAIERWTITGLPASIAGRPIPSGFTRYDLYIPHKQWAELDPDYQHNARLELENNLAIERWAWRFIRDCLPVGS